MAILQRNENNRILSFSTKMILVILFSSSEYLSAENDAHHDSTSVHHNQSLGFFLGATNEPKGDMEPTYGLEYEYKLSNDWGLGLVYETAPDAHKGDGVTTMAILAFWHPYKGWRFGLGVGKEKVGDHDGKSGASENLQRINIEYDFHINEFFIAPSYSIDIVDGENISVVGIVFGRFF